jgi:hypothetical protein
MLWALHGGRRAALAVTVGLGLVAGHLPAASFALSMVVACAIAWRRARTLAFGLGVGLLLASPQLLATLELEGQSLRSGGVSPAFAATGSLPPQEIVNGVLPKLFGYDRPADVAQSYFQRGPAYWGQGTSHWEMAFYLGVPVAFLALSTIGARLRAWWALALGALALMLGEHAPLWPLVRQLPGLDHVRFPVRFALVLTLSTAVLAAHGIDRATAMAAAAQRRLGSLALLAAGAFAAGVSLAHTALGSSRDAVVAALAARFDAPRPIDPASLQALLQPGREPGDPRRADAIVASLERSTSLAAAETLVPIAALGAVGLALHALARRRVSPAGFALVATSVLVVDLFWFGSEYQARLSPAVLDTRPATLDAIDPARGRATVVDRRQDPALDPALLSANLGLLHGTRDVIVPSPLLLPANERLLAKVGLDVGDRGAAKLARLAAHRDLVDLLGVRWLFTVHELEGFVPVRSGAVNVYENPSAMPPAFVVGCVERTGDPVAALDSLDPRRWALVETDVGVPACRDGADSGQASTTRPRSGQVLVHVEARRAALLVLTDSWYPGWSATVDGVERAIVRADATFRGVVLEPGTHRVAFRYRPAWLPWSLALVGAGLAALAWRTIHGANTIG